MSDEEGSPQEQPGSPEEQEDITTETNGDHPEESENADQETGSRKRSLSTSEEKNDDSPSKKVAKEEISLAIICDTHAKALENIKQTETAIVFHLKVKVTEDLSLATIPSAVEDVLSEDPETKCVVIVLPQDDLRHVSIPHSCKMNSCSGKGLEHTLPLPVTSLDTYMDTLKKTREELMDTYPDTEFYWVTPGPVDFKYLNRRKYENKHNHGKTTDFMWKAMISNYNKRLRVINEEIPGELTINWFTRACWLKQKIPGTQSSLHQRLLQGDLGPIKQAGLIEEGENLTAKGGQAMWVIIRKKIHWIRKSQAMGKAKTETEKEEDPSGNTEEDQKNGEEVNGKAEEDAQTENDLNESQKKKLISQKATIIGDSWIQMLSDIERWHPDNRNRMKVKICPDLTLDNVIEKVDEVLSSEETTTKNLVLSVFQNDISSGISPEYVEKEIFPCAYSTIEDLLEKASNIAKHIKKTYPQVKLFWVAPGPVGYYSEDKKQEEEKMEDDSNVQEKKAETEEKDKEDDEDKEEDDEDKEEDEDEDKEEDEDEDKEEEEDEDKEDEDKEEDEKKEKKEKKGKPEEKTQEEAEVVEEEEKEEDPELKKLRRACSSCNTIAMILNKRLHFRFKNQVVDWFEVFNSNRSGNTGPGISFSPELDEQILEGKIVTHGYLDEDFVNLSELGGIRLMKLIISTISGEKPHSRESNDHGSQGINRRLSGMGGRMDGGRGRGSGRGRGGGGRKNGGMGRRPIDKRLSWDGRGGGQHDPWSQQGGGNWKGQQRRFQGQDMRDIINRERASNNRRGGNWGGSGQYVDPWARNDYGGYYGPRY